MMKKPYIMLLILAAIGLLDSIFLSYRHFSSFTPPCVNHSFFADCGEVLKSAYAVLYGIPLALIGVMYYGSVIIILIIRVLTSHTRSTFPNTLLLISTTIGFLGSLYFVYLQIAVIQSICLYCMVSALTSTLLFVIAQLTFKHERRVLILILLSLFYKYILKKIFFIFDPVLVHNHIVSMGESMGRSSIVKNISASLLQIQDRSLEQSIHGVIYPNPIGLAAGFDYEGRLTQILPSIGFGFHTVGTITNLPYKGNPGPMLGRLPHSKSLMVNKGFKNLGAEKTARKLSRLSFETPVGISIGKTNTLDLNTQKQSVQDIVNAFITFEKSDVEHSYYELNISCPNLLGSITFYPPQNLHELLTEVDQLHIKKPLYIKMPIEKSNEEVLKMLEVIAKHTPTGVIFGNLQKNRKDSAFQQHEVSQFSVGNFSGKPTFERSNQLIDLTYKHYKERLIIIGCGGVFSGKDAYKKITLGASLIQLITGMIFQGPQLIAQINLDLKDYLKRDGFTHIFQAIGSHNSSHAGFRKYFS